MDSDNSKVMPQPVGLGRKRPLRNLSIDRLHLDPKNPRLPEEIQGSSQQTLLKYLYQHFDLEEISSSMGVNGYFDEEPLVAVPKDIPEDICPKPGEPLPKEYLEYLKSAQFVVAEGNRRLATARILRDEELRKELKIRSWPILSDLVKKDLDELPVIIYPTRAEVLPYLGVRHITGNKKWDSYAKARYISDMLAGGRTAKEIEEEVGDRTQAVLKNAIAYKTLQQAKEEIDFDLKSAQGRNFSYMLLALGQRNIRSYLGWKMESNTLGRTKMLPLSEIPLDQPIPDNALENLRHFLSFMYGSDGKRSVLEESRDITKFLTTVLGSASATEHLIKTRNLKEAYELTDGEELMVKRSLTQANSKLETAMAVAHRHVNNVEILAEAEKALKTAQELAKRLRG